jgi:hypothetical protein
MDKIRSRGILYLSKKAYGRGLAQFSGSNRAFGEGGVACDIPVCV